VFLIWILGGASIAIPMILALVFCQISTVCDVSAEFFARLYGVLHFFGVNTNVVAFELITDFNNTKAEVLVRVNCC
jgi:hypothetical protein